MDADEVYGEKAWRKLRKNDMSYIEQYNLLYSVSLETYFLINVIP